MLLNEPFWLTPEQVGRLTDREAWEWYLKPGLDRARRMRESREGRGGWDDQPAREPETRAAVLGYLQRIGVVGVPDKPPPRKGE